MTKYTRRNFIKQTSSTVVGGALIKIGTEGVLPHPISNILQPYIQEHDQGKFMLWFSKAARRWEEALPVGNGRLGSMIFGGVAVERFQLNEESVWDGFERDRINPKALTTLPQVRKLLFAGDNEKATRLADENMMGIPLNIKSYQPLAELKLTFNNSQNVQKYRRDLDLSTGIATVEYEAENGHFKREIFASAQDQIIVVRLQCNQRDKISFRTNLNREVDADVEITKKTEILLRGRCGEKGVRFAALAKLLIDGGTFYSSSGDLVVEKANSVILLIAGATDYHGDNPVELCEQHVTKASQKGYEVLKANHIKEHRQLFDRVDIDLGTNHAMLHPTDERLVALGRGVDDPQLFSLYFQYCRYLLMASSRPGCLPSNLQGIWNDKLKAPWNSDYHPNVNMQINYWPAEVYNLAECHLPLIDWMEHIVNSGSRTAQAHYGCRGWVLHHVSDIFGCTTPMDGVWGIWPMGGAWLCLHAWEHYRYSLDREYLANRAYPLMKGAALFMIDFLIEAPKDTIGAGSLVTNPSHSPENSFRKADGQISQFTYGATMDLEIINNLFTNCLNAIKELGLEKVDREFKKELESSLKRLAPLQISKKTGRLQEWIDDYEEPEPGHRHVSHLFAMYPGDQITLRGTPQLADAVRKSLEHRLSSNYDGQAWSLSWIAAIWARFEEGNYAHATLADSLAHHTWPNMFANAHGSPQVGDAEGFAAALAEMLIQSHSDEINLLPALPAKWPTGNVKGLRLRGGYEIDLNWVNGKLTRATISGRHTAICRVRSTTQLKVLSEGTTVPIKRFDKGLLEFQFKANSFYELLPI